MKEFVLFLMFSGFAAAQNPVLRNFSCADAGSTDAYACSAAVPPSAYVTGTAYRFKANMANTGPATFNLNSLGAKTIKKAAGGITTDLVDNDIRAGQWVDLVYDGTNFQMQSLLGNGDSGGKQVIAGSSGSISSAGTMPHYYGIATGSSSEIEVAFRIPFSGTLSKFQGRVTITSGSGTFTCTLRVGAAVPLTATSITASGSAAGYLTDDAHSASVNTNDLVAIQCIPSAGQTIILREWSILLTW